MAGLSADMTAKCTHSKLVKMPDLLSYQHQWTDTLSTNVFRAASPLTQLGDIWSLSYGHSQCTAFICAGLKSTSFSPTPQILRQLPQSRHLLSSFRTDWLHWAGITGT